MSKYSTNHVTFKGAAEPVIRKIIKTLFQEKHLYQSIKINVADISPAIESILEREQRKRSLASFSGGHGPTRSLEMLKQDLQTEAETFLSKVPLSPTTSGQENHGVDFTVVTIRAYCGSHECKQVMPHNLHHQVIVDTYCDDRRGKIQQIISVTYLCQNCKKEYVSFMIRRDGNKITLSGRTPMEQVQMPKFIPSEVSKFYQGAIIAFNSGAILPAIFMLRTTIEQYMRHTIDAGNDRLTGEDLADEYSKSLNSDFNRIYQSLKPVYEILSIAVHAANDQEPEIFEEELQKVHNHFEAKEMFERMKI